MKASQFFISTLKEAPADAEVVSHQLMMRAGMIKRLGAGIYNYMPMGLRVIRKVEGIIREEMVRAGAVELLMRWEDVDLGVPMVGGDGGAFTLGANWYLSDFSRLMLNVIRWNTENRSGSYLGEDKGTSIVARAQVSF